mmetsp:Transcript_41304/g.89486  ORF Transcript_41304/g.89486 Transcript_41304/m.89486 type:complete len:268 (-) Transcript_41304:74-877(-)
MSAFSPTKSPLQAHNLKPKVFLVPTWCSNCKGVLVGSGFECSGPCKMRCHIGLGANQAEHCKAELLLKPCEECECSRVQGQYRFGDMTKQIFRNEHQKIKDLVVKEALKEQRGFGKFDKLKSYAEAIQDRWDPQMVKQYLLYGVLLSNIAIFILIYWLVLVIAWPAHGYERANLLGWLQAVSNFASLTLFEGVLAVALHLLLHQVLLYSELIHGFVREILQIDLRELQIDVQRASLAFSEVTFYALQIFGGMGILSVSMWFRAVAIV